MAWGPWPRPRGWAGTAESQSFLKHAGQGLAPPLLPWTSEWPKPAPTALLRPSCPNGRSSSTKSTSWAGPECPGRGGTQKRTWPLSQAARWTHTGRMGVGGLGAPSPCLEGSGCRTRQPGLRAQLGAAGTSPGEPARLGHGHRGGAAGGGVCAAGGGHGAGAPQRGAGPSQ